MLNVVLRALILFVLVYLVIRLMGKRQVGELQPVEFVVALMAADLATQPMGNLGMPLLWGVISLLVLLFMQVAVSYASMKSIRARRLLCGEPTVVISKGVINERSGYDPVWLRRKLRGVGIRGESELVIAQLDGDTLYIQTHGGKKCCTLKVS